MIPFDGTVSCGEATVNQSTLTGEGVPVSRAAGATVYARTVIEEGELTIRVTQNAGSTRYDKIVSMIEETEKLKSGVESKAEHLADRLVPFTFIGTVLVWLLTRNVTKALSVLMVDFSCALKLAMPVTVLSAIREANAYGITVKGGIFLEKTAAANTIVFDKTGTLTKANPTVHSVFPSVRRVPTSCCALPPVWRSIFRILSRTRLSARQRKSSWSTRKCTPRWSMSSRTASNRRLTARRC